MSKTRSNKENEKPASKTNMPKSNSSNGSNGGVSKSTTKRPLNAYMQWAIDERPKLKKELDDKGGNPKRNAKRIQPLLSKRWKILDENEKEKWLNKAKQDMEKWNEENGSDDGDGDGGEEQEQEEEDDEETKELENKEKR